MGCGPWIGCSIEAASGQGVPAAHEWQFVKLLAESQCMVAMVTQRQGQDHLQGDFRTTDLSQREAEGSERVGGAQEDLGLLCHQLSVSLDCCLLCDTLELTWVSTLGSQALKVSTTITQALAQGTGEPGPKLRGFGYA